MAMAAISSAILAAPRTPKRTAAQRGSGNNRKGLLGKLSVVPCENTQTVNSRVSVNSAAASRGRRMAGCDEPCSQPSMSGVTSSTPMASPSHQIVHKSQNDVVVGALSE